jgi:hypothetical protein
MLFFARWKDRASVVLDAEDREAAIMIATSVAEGEAPGALLPLPPRSFVAEVGWFEATPAGEDEDEEFRLDLFEHTEAALVELDAVDVEKLAAMVAPTLPPCESTADDEHDRAITCEREQGHPPPHRRTEGDVVHTWSDDPEVSGG